MDSNPTAMATTADLSVCIGDLQLPNPVMPASGCFGPELETLVPFERLGAVVTKTVFREKRAGNPAHRLGETEHGMLNSVGIPSLGSEGFRQGALRRYQASGTKLIVSIGGLVAEEYEDIAVELVDEKIDAFELNLSCPNLEHPGLPIGTSPERTFAVVSRIRALLRRPLIVKLSPSTSDIGSIATCAENAGADAVVVANSPSGLNIDIHRRRAVLGNGDGGYTGPAIKPLALKLVHDAAEAVKIPVIGCGGAADAADVAEFMIAGATAVQIGTATFGRPAAMLEAIEGLPKLCQDLEVTRLRDLIGSLETTQRRST